MVICNKAGGEVGIIAFDGQRGEWRISGYDLHGFRSMQDAFPRPEILLDSALGTFIVENVLKEDMHVQRKETRFRGVRRSP